MKGKRPIVLVVDEAHDLPLKTLTRLKRLMEVVANAGALLAVLLVGQPRLRNNLRRPKCTRSVTGRPYSTTSGSVPRTVTI